MADWLYLTSEQLIELGTPHGVGPVIKPQELEAAMVAPAASFGGVELHPDVAAKAAALAFAIGKIYHPFLDGNKRAAAIGLLATVRLNGFRTRLTQAELVALILVIAEHDISEIDDDRARAEIADYVRVRLT